MELVVFYALTFLGTPYAWGGEGTTKAPGYDCSGFIQKVLSKFGADPELDQSAQALYRHFKKDQDSKFVLEKGSLLFFGTRRKIVHVALAIDKNNLLESGGGGFRTRSTQRALIENALVRIRPIRSRKDFVAAILPYYPLAFPVKILLKRPVK